MDAVRLCLAFAVAATLDLACFADVVCTRTGDAYRVDNGQGFSAEGRIGGSRIFSRVTLNGQRIGAYNVRLGYMVGTNRCWTAVDRVISADWQEEPKRLVVRCAGSAEGSAYELVEALTFDPDRAEFRADVLEIVNRGDVPFPVTRVYFDPLSSYARETEKAEERPFVVRDQASGLPQTAWRAKNGRVWGGRTDCKTVSTWHCWLGARKTAHPDLALILDLKEPLAPKSSYVVPEAHGLRAWMFAACDRNAPPEPKKVFKDVPGRPRLFLVPRLLGNVRRRCEDIDLLDRLETWRESVRRESGAVLPPEPDWLPKTQPARSREFARYFQAIRPPTRLMQIAALVYALTGDEEAGAEAKRRVLYFFGWDPKGPTNTAHNDEQGMSIMRNGVRAYDWTYALYTPEERAKVEACIVERAQQIYDRLNYWKFHLDPRNSHLGRQIGFLAEACCALMPEHPEMRVWYDYVMDIYRRLYPAWGCEDGGWNEGPHYWDAYMDFGLDSLTAVKLAMGEDIVSTKPFFRQTPWYFIYQCPPGSPISPFGDGWQSLPQRTANIRSFAVLQNDPEMLWFAEQYRGSGIGGVRDLVLDPQTSGLRSRLPVNLPQARVFPGEGLVMSHSCLTDAAKNVAFYFRSSPYGSVSHGHADQNAFCLVGYGEPLAIASGHYNYFGSPHHFRWMRQTKSVCSITYDGGKGQPYGTNSVGRIVHFQAKDGVVVFTGDASAAYGKTLSRARRDVIRLGDSVFVLRDTLRAPEPRSFEYNLHAIDKVAIDGSARKVMVSRPNAILEVFFPGDIPLTFSQTDRFDPPLDAKVLRQGFQYPDQAHFRAATEAVREAEIVSVLAVRRPDGPSPLADVRQVVTEKGTQVDIRLADGTRRTIVFFGDDTPPVVEDVARIPRRFSAWVSRYRTERTSMPIDTPCQSPLTPPANHH